MFQICPKVVLILLALLLIYSLGPWLQDELLAAGKGTALHCSVLIKFLKFRRKEQRCCPRFYSQSQTVIKGPELAAHPLLWHSHRKVPRLLEKHSGAAVRSFNSLIIQSIHWFIFYSFPYQTSNDNLLYTGPCSGPVDLKIQQCMVPALKESTF